MRSGQILAIISLIVIAILASGCTEPGSPGNNTSATGNVTNLAVSEIPDLPLPPEEEALPWFEYDITQEFLTAINPYTGIPYTENTRVRVETNDDAEGAGVLRKRISITPMYENMPMYDVRVDRATGKILRGNFTSLNMGVPHVSLVPAGSDYVGALGYLDIAARLDPGRLKPFEPAGYETIVFDGQSYNCTLANTSDSEFAYTIWLNSSLPWPARVIANPAAPDLTVRRTYELAGWRGNTSGGTGFPMVVLKPGPSKLFKIDGLAWYSYQYGDSHVLKVEHTNVTYKGIPARETKIDNVMSAYDTVEKGLFYERQADGKVMYGNFTDYVRGEPGFVSMVPGVSAQGNYYAEVVSYRDIAAAFNADRDRNITSKGSEMVEYAGRQYECIIYLMPAGSASYTVWSNASVPVPLKMTVGYGGNSDEVYRLIGYGKEKIQGIPTPTPMPTPLATPTPTPKPGPSGLFDMDGITWYQYVVAVPMEDIVRHHKLNVTYGVGYHGYQARNGTMVEEQEKYTRIEYIWPSEGIIGSYSISVNESGMVVGGAAGGRNLNTGAIGALGLDAEQASKYRDRDISTVFTSDTDRNMTYRSHENVRYKGDLYYCAVLDVPVGNTTYRVWYNATLPLPPKIIFDAHKYPYGYYEIPDRHNVTGPSTYELVEWG